MVSGQGYQKEEREIHAILALSDQLP